MGHLDTAHTRAQHSETTSPPAPGGAALVRSVNQGNRALQATYDGRDPRPFYRCQKTVDYQIPDLCATLVRSLTPVIAPARPAIVVDIGCSYGISSAVIACDLTLEEIYQHYVSPDRASLSVADLVAEDRRWFRRHRHLGSVRVLGFDTAANAVRFASEVGLLHRGWVCDLDQHEPPADLAWAMRDVDLIIGTGVFSYITPRTVERLLRTCRDDPPWMLAFPLRLTDYRPFITMLARHGLRTLRINTHPLVQQRVDSDTEHGPLAAYRGGSPPVVSRDNHLYYLADCFLSIPADQVNAAAAITAELSRMIDRSPLTCAA